MLFRLLFSLSAILKGQANTIIFLIKSKNDLKSTICSRGHYRGTKKVQARDRDCVGVSRKKTGKAPSSLQGPIQQPGDLGGEDRTKLRDEHMQGRDMEKPSRRTLQEGWDRQSRERTLT